jgi:hypothetical protein
MYTDHTDSANKNVGRRSTLRYHVANEIGGQADDSNKAGDLQASGDDKGHPEGAELRGRHIDDEWLLWMIYPRR